MLGNQSYPSASTLLGRGEKHGLSPRLQEETPLLRGLQAPALLVQRVMSPSTLQHTTKAGSGPVGTGHRHLRAFQHGTALGRPSGCHKTPRAVFHSPQRLCTKVRGCRASQRQLSAIRPTQAKQEHLTHQHLGTGNSKFYTRGFRTKDIY